MLSLEMETIVARSQKLIAQSKKKKKKNGTKSNKFAWMKIELKCILLLFARLAVWIR
jgi:hypothetical protein